MLATDIVAGEQSSVSAREEGGQTSKKAALTSETKKMHHTYSQRCSREIRKHVQKRRTSEENRHNQPSGGALGQVKQAVGYNAGGAASAGDTLRNTRKRDEEGKNKQDGLDGVAGD